MGDNNCPVSWICSYQNVSRRNHGTRTAHSFFCLPLMCGCYSLLQLSLDLYYTEDEIYELSYAREPKNCKAPVSDGTML